MGLGARTPGQWPSVDRRASKPQNGTDLICLGLFTRPRPRIRMDKGGRKRGKLFCDRRRRRSHKKVPTGRNVCRGIPRSSAAGMKQIARIAAWSRGSNGTIMNCRCSNQEPLVLVIVHIGHDLAGYGGFLCLPCKGLFTKSFFQAIAQLFCRALAGCC